MTAVKEKAYAKINLCLDVVNKREDGFHSIKTVMHTVSLHDDVTVLYTSQDSVFIKVIVEGNRHLPVDSRNLVYKAASLYLERAGLSASVTIKLVKRIPVSAGLAGGSADAAAVLRALNRINNKHFAERALLDIAAELGSDVPYCLLGGTAFCEGRGELITRLKSSMLGHFVIAVASEHISTPAAYAELDKVFSDFDGSVKTGGEEALPVLLSSLERGALTRDGLFNVFERSVLNACPGARMLKSRLIELGASASLMSGSGPSVFGVFSSLEDAERARAALEADGITAFTACSV